MEQKTPGRLAGLRIAGTREQRGDLAEKLEAHGAEVLHCPLIRIVPPVDTGELDACLARIGDYAWIAFTSVNAVSMTAARGVSLQGPSVACVGESTATAVREAGLEVTLQPERQHVKGLIESFATLPERGRVLYPRSEIAPGTLRVGLQALGYEVDDPVAYRNEPDETGMNQLKAAVANGLTVVVFASPSAARNAAAAVGASTASLRAYSIGPSTSAAIREAGMQLVGEAETHDVQALVDAILEGESANG